MQNSKLWWAMLVVTLSACGSGAVVPLQSVERTQPKTPPGVTASDYVPALDLLAVGYRDGIFELRSPAPDHVLSRGKHPSSVVNLAISPDGAHLASIDRDGRLVLSDVASGEMRELEGGAALATWSGDVVGLAWSPGGQRLAVAAGARVRLVDVSSCDEREVTLPEPVGAIGFSHDGRRLVVGGRRLHFLDGSSLAPTHEIALSTHSPTEATHEVSDLRFSPDDSRLAVLLLGAVALVDLNSGQAEVAKLPALDPVGVRFAPDGRVAVFGRHAIYVGEARPSEMASAAKPVDGDVADVEFRKDGSLLLLGAFKDADATLVQWQL